MRTTVTLDADVEQELRETMSERGISFTAALNAALRARLGMSETRIDVRFPTYAMGAPSVDLTHANSLAAALEDDEVSPEPEPEPDR